jgi:RNA polymerase sigma factor (TIGR02999 family)
VESTKYAVTDRACSVGNSNFGKMCPTFNCTLTLYVSGKLHTDVILFSHSKGQLMSSTPDITKLLQDWTAGDQQAMEKLIPVVYNELHRLAHRYMRQERPEHTLQTTALINEAYLRLIDCGNVQWRNRAQFFGVSAQMMRRILAEFARSRNYAKRGGGAALLSLEDAPVVSPERAREIVALDNAIQRLDAAGPRMSQIVELRFFGGLGQEEIAAVLNVSSRTVIRDWEMARAWLYREMNSEGAT